MRRVRRRGVDAWLAAVTGAGYVGLGPLVGSDLTRLERSVFRVMNGTSGSVPALRVPQQLGTPWLLPAMALTGLCTGRPRLAAAAAVALPLEKALEIGVKDLLQRRRPANVVEDAVLHDDAPTEGGSYPSGHAAIAACAGVLAAPYLPAYAAAGLGAAVAATTFARVHQGAHFPLDGVGGVLMGVCAGALLNYTVGLPDPLG